MQNTCDVVTNTAQKASQEVPRTMSLLNNEKIVFLSLQPKGFTTPNTPPSPTIFSHRLIFRGNQCENEITPKISGISRKVKFASDSEY
eukprot:g78661.t1